MDIAKIGSGNNAERMPLCDPRDNKPLSHGKKAMFIQGVGVSTKTFKESRQKVADRYVGSEHDMTSEILAESVECYSIYMDGVWIESGKEKLVMIFEQYDWIREQWGNFVGNKLNFLEKLPES